jgi:hypothetical protein
MSAKKKYFTINFIHLIHKVCQILSTFTSQCRCHYLHSRCSHLHHNPNIPILLTAIPQHITVSIIHCIECIAFLKPFWLDALPCCYDLHLLNITFIFVGLYTCLNTWRFTIFSTDSVKYLNTCVLDFHVVSLVWSVWVHGSFYGF